MLARDLETLRHGQIAARCQAAARLASAAAPDDAVWEALLEALHDPLWQVREAALRALAEARPEVRTVVAECLALAVHDPSVWLRASASELLERCTLDEAMLDGLRHTVASPGLADEVRVRALGLLAGRLAPADECDATVRAAMRDARWPLRQAAAQRCGERGFTGCVPMLAALAADDPDTLVRAAAIDALAALGPAAQRSLLVALADASEPVAVRRSAAEALGRLETPGDDVYDALVAALADADPGLRLAAVSSLTALRPGHDHLEVLLAVRQVLSDAHDGVVVAALEALVACVGNDRALLDALRAGVEQASRGIRIGMTRLLLRVGLEHEPEAVRAPLVELALDDTSARVRETAATALVRSQPIETLIEELGVELAATAFRARRKRIIEILGACFACEVPELSSTLLEQLAAALVDSTARLRLSATIAACRSPENAAAAAAAAEANATALLAPLILRRAFEGERLIADAGRKGLSSRYAARLPATLRGVLAKPPTLTTPTLAPQHLADTPLDEPLSPFGDECLRLLHEGVSPSAREAVLPSWRAHGRWWAQHATRRRPELRDAIEHLVAQLDAATPPLHLARAASRLSALATPPLRDPHAGNAAERLDHRLYRALVREQAWQMARLLAV